MAKPISRAKRPLPQVPISQDPVPLVVLIRERDEKTAEINSLRGLLENLQARAPKSEDRSLRAAEHKLFQAECEEALTLARIDLDCVIAEIEERSLLGPLEPAA